MEVKETLKMDLIHYFIMGKFIITQVAEMQSISQQKGKQKAYQLSITVNFEGTRAL